MDDALAWLDATAQAELIRRGTLSPGELLKSTIARIEQLNPQLNAVITPLYAYARAQAHAPTLPGGPFRGVPMLLKDFWRPRLTSIDVHPGAAGRSVADALHAMILDRPFQPHAPIEPTLIVRDSA